MATTGTQPDDLFIVSDDGMFCDWIAPAELVNRPGWTDCTQMGDHELQCFIAERQAVRPYIVGVKVH